MPFADPEDRRAYHREWEAKNKDKVREYSKQKREKFKDVIAAKAKEKRKTPEHKAWERERWYRRTPELEAARELRQLWKDSPRSRRRFYRHSKYLSYEVYKKILPQLEGGGPCDCCGRTGKKMHIDHCHRKMKFRGVLCEQCNKGIGHFGDDHEFVFLAAIYLEKFATKGAS